MTLNTENLLESIMESLDRIPDIPLSDIPNIDLYMDQLTTFMEERLSHTTRYPGEDKVLTKTMINNYAKNDLLPPPVRKKYSKDHMILLIFIYYYKNILSINDIQTLLGPLKDRFHTSDTEPLTLSDIYTEICALDNSLLEEEKTNIREKMEMAEKAFADAPEELRDRMCRFAFISMLSYDVYIKKLLIEKLIDGFGEGRSDEEKRKESRRKRKNANKKGNGEQHVDL
ncbi:MAG: DUF1836 domain-containing protein [Lachnospiraceae bacterium]|nr:DUF1836 domain-containing protein [Lachnospiraceae bacterium]